MEVQRRLLGGAVPQPAVASLGVVFRAPRVDGSGGAVVRTDVLAPLVSTARLCVIRRSRNNIC